MPWIVQNLWLIPALPLLAGGDEVGALTATEASMMKTQQVIVALAVVTSALVLYWLWPKPPSYQGKTLGEWLKSLDNHPIQFLELEPMPNQPAVDAFRAIGSNAIPGLRAELEAKDSKLKKILTQWLEKQSLIKVQLTPAEVRYSRAVGACEALGPVAKMLIPELSAVLNSGYDPAREAHALAAIGPEALPALTNAFGSPNERVRRRAASAFRLVRYDAQAAIPALVQCLDDEDPSVKGEAAMALGHIGKKADLVVPILVRNLDDTNSTVRFLTADALGFFGEQAKSAVPTLLRKMNGDPMVQPWAEEAIKKIDPSAAAKAGLK